MSPVSNPVSPQTPRVLQTGKWDAPLNLVKNGISKPVVHGNGPVKRHVSDHAYSRPSPEVHLSHASMVKAFDSNGRSKTVGKYRVGPAVGTSPVKSLQDYLVRKEGTDQFFIMRIFTCKNKTEKTSDEVQGQNLLIAERLVLTKLADMEGVMHCHELYTGTSQETVVDENGMESKKSVVRIFSVVDCSTPHDFSPKYTNLISLQSYVIGRQKLPEAEAIRLFYKTVDIVERLHQRNVVHRDIKLGNIILDKVSGEVTLANFCLSKQLANDNELLTDQRGSPAYIAPDVITAKPFLGKPADMWSMGIVLYTMLYGQFPFYHQSPIELFRKIKTGLFEVPPNVNVKEKTIKLIVELLRLEPEARLSASQAKQRVKRIIAEEESLMMDKEEDQVGGARCRFLAGQIWKKAKGVFALIASRFTCGAN